VSLPCRNPHLSTAGTYKQAENRPTAFWYARCIDRERLANSTVFTDMRNALLTHGQDSYVGALPRRATTPSSHIQLYDPAVTVMNDFSRQHPVTVDEDRPIGVALADMARLGVRSMLVVNELNVVGLITSYDIEGERPIQYIQQFHDVRRNDVQVGQIMTRWHDLVTLNWSEVRSARVIDVLQALRDADLMHLLVVEHEGNGTTSVRGLFSRSRIERQLSVAHAKTA
jgi:CBS domain-containing protein